MWGAPVPQTGNTWPVAAGDTGEAVFQNDTDGIDTIYQLDNNLRDITTATGQVGFDPTIDADGEIVFVRQVNGRSHLLTTSETTTGFTTPVDITPNSTTDCTDPAWSPDDSLIAFATPDGVETVHPDGSEPTMVTSTPGFPAYRS